jgi:uncharacterized protein YutE (UPF0331/DUF86 family)
VTDSIIVLRKLTILREHLARVKRRRPSTAELYSADTDLQDATAMSLFVAIQQALDIAMHIAVDEGWGVPASYVEGFELLAQNQVIDAALARELGGVAALRNRIAHGYATVDADRLYAETPAGLDALERFSTAVAAFLSPDA